jgi:O-antigen ligase
VSAALVALHGVLQYAGFNFDSFKDLNLDPGRAYSTLGLPGVYSVYLAVNSFLTAGLYYLNIHRLNQWLLLAVFFLFQVALYFSGTRVPAILNLAGLALYLILLFVYGLAERRGKIYFLSCAVVLAAVLSLGVLPNLTVTKTGKASLQKGSESRLTIWKSGLAGWEENKWFGAGPETYSIIEKKYETPEANRYEYWMISWSKAHNQLVQFLVSLGIFGVAAFLLFFGLFTRKILQTVPGIKNEENVFGLALGAGFAFIFLANLTAFNYIPTEIYYFVFPAAFLAVLFKAELKVYTFKSNLPAKLVFTVLFVTSLVFCLMTYRYWSSDLAVQRSYSALHERNNAQEAIDSAEDAIALFPDYSFAYCNEANVLAYLLVARGQALPPDKKTESLRIIDDLSKTCVERSPNRFEAHSSRGDLFLKLYLNNIVSDPAIAEESIEKFKALAPASPVSYFEMGLIRLKQNNIQSFKENMNKVLDLKPDYLPAYMELIKNAIAVNDEASLSQNLQNLENTKFYSGQFVPDIKNIISLLEKSGKTAEIPKLNSLYEANKSLLAKE